MGAPVCGLKAAWTPERVAGQIGRLAYRAMMEEVCTSPKPGLVDCYSNGAHTDMDIHTFERSAYALSPYFRRMALEGLSMSHTPRLLFSSIRKMGILAETAMYEATGGVNTHKGMIFHIGILSAAAGACLKTWGRVDARSLVEMELSMVAEPLSLEIAAITAAPHGDGCPRRCMAGARGEACRGYPSILKLSLPVLLDGIRAGRDWNLIKLQTLFALMERVEDSNIVSRHHRGVLLQVQEMAGKFLASGGAYQNDAIPMLQDMDRKFIRRNLSPGGCADLLAATIYIAGLTGSRWYCADIHERRTGNETVGRQALKGQGFGTVEGISRQNGFRL